MSSLGEYLGKELRDKEAMKHQLAPQGIAPAWFNFIDGEIELFHERTVVYKNTLDGTTLFWNSDNQGDWDEFDWSGDADSDGYSSYHELHEIKNPNQTFVEEFYFDTMIDSSNSTGTLDLTNHNYTLTSGEQLQSETFMYEQSPAYSTIKVDVAYTGDEPTLEIGSYNDYTSSWDWSTYNIGTDETFLAPNKKHKYRLSLPSGTSCIITKITIHWTVGSGDVSAF